MTHRPNRRRAKAAVLVLVASVAALTAGLNVALDTVRSEWRDPEFGHRVKELKPLARSAGRRSVVVALGSSRSQMGLSPEHLGLGDEAVVYNLSQAGCGPVHQVMNLHRLLDAGVKPDFVLVEVLPPVLGLRGPAEKTFTLTKLSAADLVCVAPYFADPSDEWAEWERLRAAPWHTYRLSLLSHWGAGYALPWQLREDFIWHQMRPGGWMPYFFAEVSDDRRANGLATARGQYVPYFHDFEIGPTPDRAYRDLIATCRDRGIRVAFYVMPESPTFRSWYPPAVRTRIDAYFRDLTRDTGAPLFDASAWFDDETAFADGHHLLRHAAAAFSRRFGADCVGPWVRRGSVTP